MYLVVDNSFVIQKKQRICLIVDLLALRPDLVSGYNLNRGENVHENFRPKHLGNDSQIAIDDSRLLQGGIFVPRLERILLSSSPSGICRWAIHFSKLVETGLSGRVLGAFEFGSIVRKNRSFCTAHEQFTILPAVKSRIRTWNDSRTESRRRPTFYCESVKRNRVSGEEFFRQFFVQEARDVPFTNKYLLNEGVKCWGVVYSLLELHKKLDNIALKIFENLNFVLCYLDFINNFYLTKFYLSTWRLFIK